MTKKVPKKILRIERNLFVYLRKNCFWPPAPRRRRRRFFWTGGAPPPPTQNYRRAAADTMTSAHSSTSCIPGPMTVSELPNFDNLSQELLPCQDVIQMTKVSEDFAI